MTKLQEMLEVQAGFQVRVDKRVFSDDLKSRVDYIKEYSIHLNQEMNEMLYELPFFKPWKDYSNMTKEEQQKAFDAAKEEMIDAWHFFMNILLALGFNASELYHMYMVKNQINHQRQDEGY